MTLIEHLEELRMRIFYSLAYLVAGSLVGFFVASPVIQVLARPFSHLHLRTQEKALRVNVLPDGSWKFADPVSPDMFRGASATRMFFYLPGHSAGAGGEPDFIWGNTLQKPVFFHPLDPFWLYFHTSLIVGLILAIPFVLRQIWLFVSPGLKPAERRAGIGLLAFAGMLFPAGAAMAYFMLSSVLDFLVNFQVMALEPQLEISRLIDFELKVMLAFGAVFELPVVIMFLVFLGVLTPAQLRQYRPYAIAVIALIAMIATPTPDPFSMLIMMGPLIILYEASIWLSAPLAKRRQEAEAAGAAEDNADPA